MKRVNELPSAQRRAFKVDAFCDTYGPSRSTLYKLIREGKISSPGYGCAINRARRSPSGSKTA
jgi:hypothetical protein